ncbi:MAG TPA: lysophospholipid acyltransferase family protein [Verrucomicrobiota bacterium]|nr:lysophospholipid acyltransferase family protein [Verrucomicrobiota bacterium]
MNVSAAWEQAARPTPFYRGCRWVVRCWAKAYLQWRVLHPDRVPPLGPVILAANHVSLGDPPLIGSAVPRAVNFLARESLFHSPLFGRLIGSLNAFPVDRDGGGPGGLRTVLARLEAGGAVLLFPEGTRSSTGELQEARSGIGLVVMRTEAPVIPIRVFGLYEAWGRHRRFPRPHPIVIKFGAPMKFDCLRAEMATAGKTRVKAIYQQVSEEIMDAISGLQPAMDVTEFP